jgi:hypothetical protein
MREASRAVGVFAGWVQVDVVAFCNIHFSLRGDSRGAMVVE